MPRIFVSGPITGMPDFRPNFLVAEQQLKNAGYDVHNPAENKPEGEATWLVYMRISLRELLNCDGLAYIDGWQYSRGAQVEVALAESLGIPVKSVWEWIGDVEK